LTDALSEATKAVEISDRKAPSIPDTLAEVYFESGRFDDAIENEKKVLGLDPTNLEI
jgi:tetratricopeptide (TPR) repeat protein